ncbi:hypothetical protein NC652_029930 [Populus alba x Populus x berolinensis]|nr:hypothetical protein NC652_029930 [Populus alba x Populus x berolinensis]
MEFSRLFITLLILQAIFLSQASIQASPAKPHLFREYIGAEFNNVRFTDVPVNPNVDFHFILSFAIDYDTSSSPSPTNEKQHSNVKVALSLGGDSVANDHAYFNPSSVDSWVSNAVSSLTRIIQQYNLDGIDIDYEHFQADPDTFTECIGQLITALKRNGVISFASIAPFVLVSFISDGSGGLSPANGFFTACSKLKSQNQLHGIFVWSADDSKAGGFRYEKRSQALLAIPPQYC